MKVQFSIAVAALMAMTGVGYANAAKCTNCAKTPSVKVYNNINYIGYPTKTGVVVEEGMEEVEKITVTPKTAVLYKGVDSSKNARSVKSAQSISDWSSSKRKYYLAHPFFQPLQYKFGSVTDFGYNYSRYNVDFYGRGTKLYGPNVGDPLESDPYVDSFQGQGGKWTGSGFSIKEDLSFGITDRLALMGMIRYDYTDSKFDWSNGTSDSDNTSDLNMWGLGVQGRIVDTDDWIATTSFFFEHQKDFANNFILELKAGYKISQSTLYVLGRGWLVDFDGNTYGNGISGRDGEEWATIFLAYKKDVDNAFYGELGFGDFTVLAKDWTFNIEALFGHYDWHNQLSLKAAFGWQPNDWVALNLYGRASLYDSAKSKDVDVYYRSTGLYFDPEYTLPATGWNPMGGAHLSDYQEYSVGLQAIFMF